MVYKAYVSTFRKGRLNNLYKYRKMELKTNHGKLELPCFFPDATYGKVKSVSSVDLEKIKVDGLVVNAYHILRHHLAETINKAGGIQKFMKLNKPIISDSGGFQVMSLIHNNPRLGKITEKGAFFKLDNKKILLTPEKCIQIQVKLGSDIVMCLDDCTKPEDKQKESVLRTIAWARRCKTEFLRLTRKMSKKPLLFAIIQGGENKKLRKLCSEKLTEIGFDGYSFGGWPIKNGKLLAGILKYVAGLIPDNKPKYAMGLGKPQDIIVCTKMGYNIFDCVIPTRDARHKRLFIFTNKNLGFKEISVRKKYFRYKLKYCDCELCKNYNIKELHRLFRTNKEKAFHLATIHNLSFYSGLIRRLRLINSS